MKPQWLAQDKDAPDAQAAPTVTAPTFSTKIIPRLRLLAASKFANPLNHLLLSPSLFTMVLLPSAS